MRIRTSGDASVDVGGVTAHVAQRHAVARGRRHLRLQAVRIVTDRSSNASGVAIMHRLIE